MSTVAIPIETTLFLDLSAFLTKNNSSLDPVQAVSTAVSYWIENADWKTEELVPTKPLAQGYRWKLVHLPAGTILRIRTSSDYQYATIENDYPLYKGERHSPNQFARAATGSERDAWRDVWVRRPDDADYVPAADLRRQAEDALRAKPSA